MNGIAMQTARINGVDLAYEVSGTGEAVLLVGPVLADGFLPFLDEPSLADRFRLVHYHRRGWGRSTATDRPATIGDHAADAAALLEHLEVRRAHVAGHSHGGTIALQLAIDRPRLVRSLALLEPGLLTVPSAGALLEKAGPAVQAHAAGDEETAVAIFLSAVSGLDWETCRTIIERRVPGGVTVATADAATLFDVELPAVGAWTLETTDAAAIAQPVLSVRGGDTEPLWVEVADLLRSRLSDVETCVIEGAGHLLHIQRPEPVARALAEFFGRHPMAAEDVLCGGGATADA